MRLPALLLAALLVAGCFSATRPTSNVPVTGEPIVPFSGRVGHVFLIVLENEGYETTFGASPGSPYLGHALPLQGRLLTQYYAVGHVSLDNYIAMISGQAPNPETEADCPVFTEFHEVTQVNGQAVGQGCVYPKDVKNLGDQLSASGHTWRMYAQDMAAGAPATCRHPPVDARDPWEGASGPKDQYVTKHVPFVYFHGIIDDKAACDAHVVDLKLLDEDLNNTTMPQFAFISPNLCDDGHDSRCASGEPGGYSGIERFLSAWVPRITTSTAYRTDGLIIIAFDESESDSSACCDEQPGYNTVQPGTPGGKAGDGGGRTGALLLSPCFTNATTDETPYNHYSLLRTLEAIYGVAPLGYAAQDGLKTIGLGACPARGS